MIGVTTVSHGGSVRARWLATQNLRSYLMDLDPADLPAWRAFFVQMLSASEVTDTLREAIEAVVIRMPPTAAENADALAGLDGVLHAWITRPVHVRAVCAAFKLTQGDTAAWRAFADGLEDAPLAPNAAELLQDPSACSS